MVTVHTEQDSKDDKLRVGGEVEENDQFKRPRTSFFRKLEKSISLNDYLDINY